MVLPNTNETTKLLSNGEKNSVLWSKSWHQNNAWPLVVFKEITNEGKSIFDITRQIHSEHGSYGLGGTGKRDK